MESSLKILEDYGLDGLDVDYEYPHNDEQARGYALLLREMREALDGHAEKKGQGCRFLLSVRLLFSLVKGLHSYCSLFRSLLPVEQTTTRNFTFRR